MYSVPRPVWLVAVRVAQLLVARSRSRVHALEGWSVRLLAPSYWLESRARVLCALWELMPQRHGGQGRPRGDRSRIHGSASAPGSLVVILTLLLGGAAVC